MSRPFQYIAIFLLLIVLVFTFLPEKTEKTPEREFMDSALACHMNFRPSMEQALRSPYTIWKVDETCGDGYEGITTDVLSGAVHVLRSEEYGYELVFTPRVVGDTVEWSCASTVQNTFVDCNPDG